MLEFCAKMRRRQMEVEQDKMERKRTRAEQRNRAGRGDGWSLGLRKDWDRGTDHGRATTPLSTARYLSFLVRWRWGCEARVDFARGLLFASHTYSVQGRAEHTRHEARRYEVKYRRSAASNPGRGPRGLLEKGTSSANQPRSHAHRSRPRCAYRVQLGPSRSATRYGTGPQGNYLGRYSSYVL